MFNIFSKSRFSKEKGFTVKPDGDKGYRRVVASPAPVEVLEARAIQVGIAPSCQDTSAECYNGPVLLRFFMH